MYFNSTFINRKQMSTRHLQILIIFLLGFNILYSQNKSYLTNNLQLDEGLSSASVTSTAEDKLGFVWIGTLNGLNRFDGYNFEIFRSMPDSSNGLKDNIITALHTDKNFELWIGTSGGLYRYDYSKDKFVYYDLEKLLNKKLKTSHILSINSISVSGEPLIVVSMLEVGLLLLNPQNNSTMLYEATPSVPSGLSDGKIIGIAVKNEKIFLATRNKGIILFDYKLKTFENISINSNISERHFISVLSLKSDTNEILCGSGNSGLYKYLIDKNHFEKVVINNFDNKSRIVALSEVGDKIWLSVIGTGIFILNNDFEIEKIINSSGVQSIISSDIITSIFEDSYGNVWVGNSEAGINLISIDKSQISTLLSGNEIKEGSVYSLAVDVKNDLWVGTAKTLEVFHGDKKKSEVVSLGGKKSHIITEIFYSPLFEDKIFAATFNDGVYQINLKDKTSKKIFNKTRDGKKVVVHKIVEGKDKTLWFGTNGSGIINYNLETGKFIQYTNDIFDSTSIPSNLIVEMAVQGDSVWVGTYDGKLSVFDKTQNKFSILKTHDLGIVLAIHFSEIDKDVVWFGTGGNGLFKYDKNTGEAINFTIENGLLNNSVVSILEDANHNLVMATNAGISKFNLHDNSFINITKDDGLQSNEFNLGVYAKNSEGQMFFGGANGLSYFNPENILVDSTEAIPIITDLYLFNKKVAVSDSSVLSSSLITNPNINLSYSDYIFAFEFTSLGYNQNKKIKYLYNLEGFNTKWIHTSANQRIVTFTNIPNGEYIFKVKTINHDGVLGATIASVNLRIFPPWWKTWWAYIVYLFSFVAILFAFIKWRTYEAISRQKELEEIVSERTKELKSLNENKDRFFSIVAHEITTPIVAVLKFSKILKSQFSLLTENEKEESISEIHDSLDTSYRYITNLLDWSRLQRGRFNFNPQNINLNKIVEECFVILKTQSEIKEINLIQNVNNSTSIFADYKMISIIFANLISNAVKFTKRGGTVKVSSTFSEKGVTIIFADNGVGIGKEDLLNIFELNKQNKSCGTENERGTGLGLILCKDLLLKNNGDILINSVLGEGTKVTVNLPKGIGGE